MRFAALLLCCIAAPLAACAKRASSPPPPPPPPRDEVLLVRDTTPVGPPPAEREGPRRLTPAYRDSLEREATVRRAAWQARGIKHYRLLVAVGCFCPWPSNPAIIEVKDGVVVALSDTTGRSMGKPREPWSSQTVEALFDDLIGHARQSAAITVRFDPQYGYPTSMSGTGRAGPPDSWFWVSATRLTPLR